MARWNVIVVGLARFTAAWAASTCRSISPPRISPRNDFACCSARVLAAQLVALAASASAAATSFRIWASSSGLKENGDDGTAYIRLMLLMWFSVSRCRSPDGQRAHHFAKCLTGVRGHAHLHLDRLVAVDLLPGRGHLPVPLVPLPHGAECPTAHARTALRRRAVVRVGMFPRDFRRAILRNLRLFVFRGFPSGALRRWPRGLAHA